MLKTYKILISFGDGRPVHSKIEAKNGQLAQDLAMAKNPGARSIRILGIESVREEPKPKPKPKVKPKPVEHPFFTDLTFNEVAKYLDRDSKIQECLNLKRQGKSHKEIAYILDIGKTTVGSWLKLYGKGKSVRIGPTA